MSKKVLIVDYQLGNLFSVQQACAHLGYNASISSSPEEVLAADYVILPGVGAFADAITNLRELGLSDALYAYIKTGRPLMGVCLGLQLLLTDSEEFGLTKGLGLIEGTVKKFPVQTLSDTVYKVPQIQWNTISEPETLKWNGSPLQCCKPGDFMYFVHSFYAQPADSACILSKTVYGELEYCSSVMKDNIFATQFHPEKSGLYGLNIYKEWFTLFD